MTKLDLLENFSKILKLNELNWDIRNKNLPNF